MILWQYSYCMKQDWKHSESFMSLSKNLENSGSKMYIVVYDNSPVSEYEKEAGFENWNIHYIHYRSNPGVSKAYNDYLKRGFHPEDKL